MRIFLTLSILLWMSGLHAQQTDYDAVIQPVDVKAREFSEYLVQLAWLNSPMGAIAQAEVRNAQDELRNTRKEWMRDVQATINLNEANLKSNSDSSSNIFFPRYNFGININLFNAMTQPRKNKIGKREIEIAQYQVKQQKLEIRAETLTRYASFRLNQEILKTRSLVEQESYNNYILIQQLYKTDEKTFDEYTLASSAYYQAQEARIRAESEVQVAKFRLEEIIGLKWEQVQHPAKE